jgi:hypothetical protein
MSMIDKEDYLKGKGLACPFCGSELLEGGFIHVETGNALQKMSCTECDGIWQDVFQLVDVIFEHGAEAA